MALINCGKNNSLLTRLFDLVIKMTTPKDKKQLKIDAINKPKDKEVDTYLKALSQGGFWHS